MDHHTFLYDDPTLINAYLRAFRMQQETKERDAEYNAWLQGSYVYEAVAVVMEHAFAKNARSRYPDRPRKTPSELLREQKAIEDKKVLDPKVALFHAQFKTWAKNFGKKQGS